jgi:hypothetical protein
MVIEQLQASANQLIILRIAQRGQANAPKVAPAASLLVKSSVAHYIQNIANYEEIFDIGSVIELAPNEQLPRLLQFSVSSILLIPCPRSIRSTSKAVTI